MHHCLLVAELAQRVAEACAPDYKSIPTNKPFRCPIGFNTLCALARTCRALQDPALDVIWYHQRGLEHLIDLLPEDVWEVYEGELSAGQTASEAHELRLKLKSGIRNWERFDFYANRVHKFEYWLSEDPKHMLVNDITYEVLCARGTSIFPKLQSLVWQTNYRGDFDRAFRFLQCQLLPTLTSVDILLGRGGGPHTKLVDVLSEISMQASNLEKIKLTVYLEDIDIQQLSQIFRRSAFLQKLALHISLSEPGLIYSLPTEGPTHLTTSNLSRLAALPQLRELHLFTVHALEYVKDERTSPNFPMLDTLSLSSVDARTAQELLADVSIPAIRSLFLSFREPHSSSFGRVPNLIRSKFTSKDLLETLEIFPSQVRPPLPYSRTTFSASLYDPLRDFHNLRRVRLDSGFGLNLRDSDLEAFGRSWPHLESLHIINNDLVERRQADKPTYEGIASLVKLCPNLTTLCLPISGEANGVRTFLESANMVVSPHEVSLNFMYSPVNDLDTMALWIARIFPRCTTILHAEGTSRSLLRSTDYGRRPWTELMRLVDRYKVD